MKEINKEFRTNSKQHWDLHISIHDITGKFHLKPTLGLLCKKLSIDTTKKVPI